MAAGNSDNLAAADPGGEHSGDAQSHQNFDGSRRIAAAASAGPLPLWSLILGLAGFILISGVAIAIYAYSARSAADRDPFIYAEIAKEMLAGKKLYRDTWIDKPPLALLMYAAPQLVAPRSYRAIVVFCAVVIVLQGLLFAIAFRHTPAAAVAAALFLIFYPLEAGVFTWPSTEHFANLYITGCLLITLTIARRRDFSVRQCVAAGMLAIAAFHVRQNTVLCGLLPFLAVVLANRPAKDRILGVVWMIAGGLLAWGVMLAIVLLIGDWQGYWWALFVYPRRFASLGSFEEMVQLLLFFGNSLLMLVLLVFGVLAAQGRYLWLVIATAVIGAGTCLVASHNHPHYLANSLPYLTLLIGLGTEQLRQFGPIAPWVAAAAMSVLAVLGANGRVKIATAEPTVVPLMAIAAETDRLAPDDATLWVCGPQPSEAIQFASRLLPANRHCWIFQMRSPWKELMPKPWETILTEYVDHPPDVLVVHQGIEREAQAPPSPRAEPEYLQLLRVLLTKFHYRSAAVVEGYSILQRGD